VLSERCQRGPQLSTAKGDIRIAEAVRGAVVLRTQAGDVSVGAAAGVDASLDAGVAIPRRRNARGEASGLRLQRKPAGGVTFCRSSASGL
jgi:hypothetical protein